jgi:cell division protein FtsA
MHISLDSAEKLKIFHGCCLPSLVPQEEFIEVPALGDMGPEQVQLSTMCGLLEDRVDEIMEFINSEFIRSGFDEQINGVVVTGGSSLLKGVPELSRQVLEKPVRRGMPGHIGGLTEIVKDPKYSTAVGLCLYSLRQEEGINLRASGYKGGKTLWDKLRDRLASFFRG